MWGHCRILEKLWGSALKKRLGITALRHSFSMPKSFIMFPSVLISILVCLRVYISSNCTFDFHVANVYKRCSNLTGWILRTFNSRETRTMMALFKSLVSDSISRRTHLGYYIQPTVQYFKAGQTYFFKRDQGSDEGNKEENIGDGANIHHEPSYESNQELQK